MPCFGSERKYFLLICRQSKYDVFWAGFLTVVILEAGK
jgi:hypothetical protein